jgi:cation transport regulator
MSYTHVHDLPEAVRAHLPEHAQHIYLEAFNHAYSEYQNPKKRREDTTSQEEVAHKVAWSAVKHKYRKNVDTGYWELKAAS